MTANQRLHALTGIATTQHFLVDGICACCLYQLQSLPMDVRCVMAMFVVYNVLAFLTQPLTGHLADRARNRHWLLLLSVALLALATLTAAVVLTVGASSMMAVYGVCMLLGIGNSLFHVWGGKQVAEATANDIRFVGLFVSTGAMGLAVGVVFCSWPLLFVLLLFLACLSAVFVLRSPSGAALAMDRPLPRHRFDRWAEVRSAQGVGLGLAWLVVLGLMVMVLLRSMLGGQFTMYMTGAGAWPVFLTVGGVSMLGKMAGGWLARGLGIVALLVLVLLVVAGCYVCRPVAGMPVMLTGLFAVNCTMPVTLYLAQAAMRGREGLAFGLLAAALIPGYLLALL